MPGAAQDRSSTDKTARKIRAAIPRKQKLSQKF